MTARLDRELNPAELEAFGQELDALRQRTLADLGEADARYIRRVRGVVRLCCWSGRALQVFPETAHIVEPVTTPQTSQTIPAAKHSTISRCGQANCCSSAKG